MSMFHPIGDARVGRKFASDTGSNPNPPTQQEQEMAEGEISKGSGSVMSKETGHI